MVLSIPNGVLKQAPRERLFAPSAARSFLDVHRDSVERFCVSLANFSPIRQAKASRRQGTGLTGDQVRDSWRHKSWSLVRMGLSR